MAGGLVIVGASLAGMRAAQAARNADYEGELTLIGEEQHMPYTRPPLSKDLLAGIDDVGSCHFPADGLEVTWRLGERATALDSGARRVMLDGGEAVEYDQVVLATGCRARPWPGPGGELEGVYTLRHLDDALALQRALAGRPKLAIVGAGFIGCEVAASARKLGIDVTLVDIAPLPMPGLGEVIGERCVQMHREHGVDLRLGTGITALHGNATGHVEAIELGDGTRIDAQVVVVALGAIPNTEWLEGSRLTLEPGVLCDPHRALDQRRRAGHARRAQRGGRSGRAPRAHERPDVLVGSVRREDPGGRAAASGVEDPHGRGRARGRPLRRDRRA
jgi:3-phenylpropionate/trans-cinnamate dioxygenase ferredoxin reductase component